MNKNYSWLKRLFDIAASFLGLLLLAPLFLMVAMGIKILEPDSPVFFKQRRVGKDGKLFSIYKFRTMVVDAEEMLEELLPANEISGAMFKIKQDPRITGVGKILRRTSIDEFPQLFNVLAGSMSLIGPRPPLVREVADYDDHAKKRLQIKPGCTGLWQVSGRNQLCFEEMVTLDLKYIEDLSFRLDLKIFLKTFKVLFKQEGC